MLASLTYPWSIPLPYPHPVGSGSSFVYYFWFHIITPVWDSGDVLGH
jgi:hypothetical protein